MLLIQHHAGTHSETEIAVIEEPSRAMPASTVLRATPLERQMQHSSDALEPRFCRARDGRCELSVLGLRAQHVTQAAVTPQVWKMGWKPVVAHDVKMVYVRMLRRMLRDVRLLSEKVIFSNETIILSNEAFFNVNFIFGYT